MELQASGLRIWCCGRECPFEMMMPWKGGAQILTLTRAKLAGAAQSAARRAKSQLMPAHISPLEITTPALSILYPTTCPNRNKFCPDLARSAQIAVRRAKFPPPCAQIITHACPHPTYHLPKSRQILPKSCGVRPNCCTAGQIPPPCAQIPTHACPYLTSYPPKLRQIPPIWCGGRPNCCKSNL